MKAATTDPRTWHVLSFRRDSINEIASSVCSLSNDNNFGMDNAAVFLTYGLMSWDDSLMADRMRGAITGTRIEDNTLKADPLIKGLGSLRLL